MAIRPLTLEEAEFIAHALAVELMDYDNEPMPPFNTRSPGILESCLAEPFQTFDGKNLHPTFVSKTAIMFYLVIKNHPFSNGNKRMAVVLTTVFCYVNKRWLNVKPEELYKLACKVAKSEPAEKEKVISVLETKFKEFMTPLSVVHRFLN